MAQGDPPPAYPRRVPSASDFEPLAITTVDGAPLAITTVDGPIATEATLATLATEATLSTLAGDIADGVAVTGTMNLTARNAAGTADIPITGSVLGLNVRLAGPVGGFGDLLTTHRLPRVQIDGVGGYLVTDHERFLASGGSVTFTTDSVIACATGVSVGGYGVLRSRRQGRYLAGLPLNALFTAYFTGGAALYSGGAGMFSATEGVFFGYNGATFGLTRRIAGASQIVRLTVVTGSSGLGTITITLNGVPFLVPTAVGALTATETAELIAETGSFTGWTSAISPQANGATVTFIQASPAAAAGVYSISGSGTAGSFATLQVGAPNDDTTGFVPKTAWNVDRLDGSGGEYNPSGYELAPENLNVYAIQLPFLGVGAIWWGVQLPSGGAPTVVHVTRYAGTAQIPHQIRPAYRGGWFSASLGSTTNLTVGGCSVNISREGVEADPSTRDSFSATHINHPVDTTESVAVAFRVRGEFASRVNLREVMPHLVTVGVDTSTRTVRVRIVLNPTTIVGALAWSYVNQDISCMEVSTPTGATITGGQELAADVATSGAPARLPLDNLQMRLEPGDVVVILQTTASSTATTLTSMTWLES